jgi:BTB/POZ domain-containing protein KCTD9
MSGDGQMRKTYEESCKELQRMGWLRAGSTPPLPSRRPRYDDPEPLGVEFFRTRVADDKFENLTLPRTFFGRSEIKNMSFKGSDLSESTFCWNDFITVDFAGCELARSDLRAALFERVSFLDANLSQCDLRRSEFRHCNFSRSNLEGAKLTKSQASSLNLSADQKRQVDWQEFDGDEPGRGMNDKRRD